MRKISFAALACACTFYLAIAQEPPHDLPSGPHALQGDTLPPFGMIQDDGQYRPGPHEVPPGMHPSAARLDIAAPTLALAVQGARAAIDACKAAGFRIGAAVIDSVGQPRALLSADGTNGSFGFVAMRKAEVALAFGRPSSEIEDLARTDMAVRKRITPSMFVAGGAVPIVVKGVTIGAIGSSGAAGKIIGAQDEVCASAGRSAILARLK